MASTPSVRAGGRAGAALQGSERCADRRDPGGDTFTNDRKAIKYAGCPSVLTSGREGRPEGRVDVEGEPEEERDDRHEDDELRYGPASDQVEQVRGVEEILD